mmetsp:Transcript_11368/g.17064  ORF Transcript_11368/g.17064 Transcript_11368/m.17064 type:complete len:637 (+) Transcript_11368:118-2028(+)|eukprot:CAMPEP_0196819262 /NCGR_PEP_ID=MMETSP1362-20130617/69778_1 /TAXON_ID=163516 /ORGANISM="Leptocylindrus danicus, Strain CCMP1856" /LENGTH=636 /DNA_ID=CAMNT_0042197679 /DNA_START=48 /DNA_END=1958 /DNA_ORIENTATION=+
MKNRDKLKQVTTQVPSKSTAASETDPLLAGDNTHTLQKTKPSITQARRRHTSKSPDTTGMRTGNTVTTNNNNSNNNFTTTGSITNDGNGSIAGNSYNTSNTNRSSSVVSNTNIFSAYHQQHRRQSQSNNHNYGLNSAGTFDSSLAGGGGGGDGQSTVAGSTVQHTVVSSSNAHAHAQQQSLHRSYARDDGSALGGGSTVQYNANYSVRSEPSLATTRQSYQQNNQGQQQRRQSVGSQSNQQQPVSPNRLRLIGESDLPQEVYIVRKNALRVMEPLTSTWIVMSLGMSMTVALAVARILHLLPTMPYWIILAPSWFSHLVLFFLHLQSAKALSLFISDANENRQRPDSTDHLDRTEYLPLLQRSLKFGLKTGTLSSLLLIFEILIFAHLSQGSVSLMTCFFPVWILVVGGILDGVICKTQNLLRLLCWVLAFISMTMVVLKLDYGFNYTWQSVLTPLAMLLTLAGGSLVYVLYGNQLGYFQLTENQFTAGILYCIAIFMMVCLVAVFSEIIPGMDPDFQTRMFVAILAPLVVALVGLGAWGVSKDEYKRLLLLGGQQSIHPMRLQLEPAGWTCVESRGVALFPMFGEVSYEPLDSKQSTDFEMCVCCACYPKEEKDEDVLRYEYPEVVRGVSVAVPA